MDRYIHSLAEAMLVTTIDNTDNSFIFPIIDVLDKV